MIRGFRRLLGAYTTNTKDGKALFSSIERRFPFKVPPIEEKEIADEVEVREPEKVTWVIAPRTRILHPDWSRIPMEEDDVRMIGDYPDYGTQSYQERDPYVKYFDQQGRRHFGEGVPEDFEALSVWAPDISRRYGLPWMLGGPAVLFGGTILLYLLVKDIPGPVPPLVS